MAGISQYIQETRGELKHVAWPTRNQTIVYTLIIAGISIFVAAYLGIFDFLFTTGIARLAGASPAASNAVTVTQQPATSTATTSTSNYNTTIPATNTQ